MANELGRLARLYFKEASPPTVPTDKVGQIFDVDFPQEAQIADKTSNDSGPREEKGVVRVTGDIAGKFFTSRGDVGQDNMRNAMKVDGAGTAMGYFEWHPEGTQAASGKPKETGYGVLSLKRGQPKDGYAVTDFTISPSGAVTPGTQ